MFSVSPISKSKSYKFKVTQNNTAELVSISLPYTYYKESKTMPTNRLNIVALILDYVWLTFIVSHSNLAINSTVASSQTVQNLYMHNFLNLGFLDSTFKFSNSDLLRLSTPFSF